VADDDLVDRVFARPVFVDIDDLATGRRLARGALDPDLSEM
jgi:hypothetical protein